MITEKTQLTITIRPNEKEKYNAKLFVLVELDGKKARGYADSEIQASAIVAQFTAVLLGSKAYGSAAEIEADEVEADEVETQPEEPMHSMDDILDEFLDGDAQKGA